MNNLQLHFLIGVISLPCCMKKKKKKKKKKATWNFRPGPVAVISDVTHSRFEHLLHVLNLAAGELPELGVGVQDLGAGLARLPLPLVQLPAPQQLRPELRVRVGGAGLLLGAGLGSRWVQGHRVLGSVLDLQPPAELRRQLVRRHRSDREPERR